MAVEILARKWIPIPPKPQPPILAYSYRFIAMQVGKLENPTTTARAAIRTSTSRNKTKANKTHSQTETAEHTKIQSYRYKIQDTSAPP